MPLDEGRHTVLFVNNFFKTPRKIMKQGSRIDCYMPFSSSFILNPDVATLNEQANEDWRPRKLCPDPESEF